MSQSGRATLLRGKAPLPQIRPFERELAKEEFANNIRSLGRQYIADGARRLTDETRIDMAKSAIAKLGDEPFRQAQTIGDLQAPLMAMNTGLLRLFARSADVLRGHKDFASYGDEFPHRLAGDGTKEEADKRLYVAFLLNTPISTGVAGKVPLWKLHNPALPLYERAGEPVPRELREDLSNALESARSLLFKGAPGSDRLSETTVRTRSSTASSASTEARGSNETFIEAARNSNEAQSGSKQPLKGLKKRFSKSFFSMLKGPAGSSKRTQPGSQSTAQQAQAQPAQAQPSSIEEAIKSLRAMQNAESEVREEQAGSDQVRDEEASSMSSGASSSQSVVIHMEPEITTPSAAPALSDDQALASFWHAVSRYLELDNNASHRVGLHLQPELEWGDDLISDMNTRIGEGSGKPLTHQEKLEEARLLFKRPNVKYELWNNAELNKFIGESLASDRHPQLVEWVLAQKDLSTAIASMRSSGVDRTAAFIDVMKTRRESGN